MKLWKGRFSKEATSSADEFNASILVDQRMVKQDIRGSIAHVEMLGRQGIIPASDAHAIREGLEGILTDVEMGKLSFSKEYEDIHMAVETILTERIGDTGKKLHTARSRNDQVATDLRLYLKEELVEHLDLLERLDQVLAKQMEEHKETVLPGYTHMQRAQPVTLAWHLGAYREMLKRDRDRLADCYGRTDCLPLGACALAGTAYPIDRKWVQQELGFRQLCENTMDAVSDRDFALEFIFCASMVMMHLSRFCEELRKRGGDGGEYGATTGRPRRVGWFDGVATRYGCRIQGATQVALTVLDPLGYLDEIPVCVGYYLDGEVINDFPSTAKLYEAKPVLKVLPGWKTDIRGIREFHQLPIPCQNYIREVEKLIGYPITMVSNGPGREDIIFMP